MSLLERIQLPDDEPGHGIYRADVAATGAFVVAAAISTAIEALRAPFAVLSAALFGVGCLAFIWAYAAALNRSRHQAISVASIFGLSGSAPGAVQARFHTLTAVQTVVAIVAAAMRPFTAQAFGILVPMLGLGLGGLWAARHGDFGQREPRRRSSGTQSKGPGTDG